MQTLIVKDKQGQVIARVITMSGYTIERLDDLVELLIDKGNEIA